MELSVKSITLVILMNTLGGFSEQEQFCTKDAQCSSVGTSLKPRYLFYDVNFPEGFNLRRDVYMRLAIFMHSLQKKGLDWHLVLPPWHRLYHWKSTTIGDQNFIPWSMFFDVESLKRFAPVIEFHEILHEVKKIQIENIYSLHHFKEAFSQPNWDWSDRWSFRECDNDVLCTGKTCTGSSYILEDGEYRGWFWGYKNITSRSLQCVSFQGSLSLLEDVLNTNPTLHFVMVDHAEVVVHESFGDALYWKCRRSMRFAKPLVEEAYNFRLLLGSNDTADASTRPKKWENEKMERKAIGGPYVCAHLRRADFLYGRGNQLPTLQYAAEQIKNVLNILKLETVFIATDSTPEEVKILESNLKPSKLVQYKPDYRTRLKIKDGGVAIVDQIICSYSRYFIGTHESTFTFRIQEEREIMGFNSNSTFNVFCPDSKKCFESSRWKIVF